MERFPDDTELHRITKQEITLKSRDNARTPMQWSNSPHAGFSTSEPWQKENESYTTINAASQVGVKGSVFEHWSSVLRLRKEYKDIFIYGDFELLDAESKDVFAYVRTFGDQKAVVVCSFRKESVGWKIPDGVQLLTEKRLISNYQDIEVTEGTAQLRPFEAFACLAK